MTNDKRPRVEEIKERIKSKSPEPILAYARSDIAYLLNENAALKADADKLAAACSGDQFRQSYREDIGAALSQWRAKWGEE